MPVDQQRGGRVDGAGARLPQVLAALGDLLDHFVAVHRPLGEQRQDGGADVAAPAATTAATPATWAAAPSATAEAGTAAEAGSTEAGTAEATAEAGAKAGSEATERAVMAAVVVSDRLAEFVAKGTSSIAPLLVDGPSV